MSLQVIDRDINKPVNVQLLERLRSAIASKSYKPGEKLPTAREIAKKMAVSTHTVRRAISQLQEEGLVEATVGRGTFVTETNGNIDPMPSPFDAGITNIGIISKFSDTDSPKLLSPQSTMAVIAECAKLEINAQVLPPSIARQEISEIAKKLRATSCDGLLWLVPSNKDMVKIEKLHAMGIPVVITARSHFHGDASCIEIDYESAAYAAGRYFSDAGCDKAVFFDVSPIEPDGKTRTFCLAPTGSINGLKKAFRDSDGTLDEPVREVQLDGQEDDVYRRVIEALRTDSENIGLFFGNGHQLYWLLQKDKSGELLKLLQSHKVVVGGNPVVNKRLQPYLEKVDCWTLTEESEMIATAVVQKLITIKAGYLVNTKTMIKPKFEKLSECLASE